MKLIYVFMFSLFIVSCKNTNNEEVFIDEQQESIDSVNLQIEQARIIDSMKIVETNNAKERELINTQDSSELNSSKKKESNIGVSQ